MIVITLNMRGQKVSQSRCKRLKADYEKYCILKMIQEQENTVHFVPQSHPLLGNYSYLCVLPGCRGVPRERGPAAEIEGGSRGSEGGHQCCCAERYQKETD